MHLGAAKLLKRHESSLNGTVYLAFQPAEEGGAGARKMMENGLVAMTPRVDAAFALHNWPYPETPSGTVGTRAGTIMAGSAAFEITLTEASSENAVVCAAGVVEALQTVIARRVDPLQPALVTVAAVQTLEEPKPASVRLLGQFHATDPGVFESLFASVRFVATGGGGARVRVRRRLRASGSDARRRRGAPRALPSDGERRARRGSGRARAAGFGADAVSDASRRHARRDFGFSRRRGRRRRRAGRLRAGRARRSRCTAGSTCWTRACCTLASPCAGVAVRLLLEGVSSRHGVENVATRFVLKRERVRFASELRVIFSAS